MKEELTLKTLQAQGVFRNSALSGDTTVSRRAMVLNDVKIVAGEERTFVAKATCPITDRDGEFVDAKGMEIDEYLTNPVLCWNHTYSTPPVGKAVAIDGGDRGLLTKFQMASTAFANDLWELVKEGMVNTVSAGFLRKEVFKRGQPGFTDACEKAGLSDIPANLKQICTKSVLVEISLCCMPVNRGAMIMAVATKGLKELATQMGLDMRDEQDTEGEEPSAETPDSGTVGVKPLPNEHAARQENPDHFHRFRRMNNIADGVSFIIGFDDQHKSKVQSVRFDARKFTPDQAKEWLKKHTFSDSSFVEATGPTKTEEVVDGQKANPELEPKESNEDKEKRMKDEAVDKKRQEEEAAKVTEAAKKAAEEKEIAEKAKKTMCDVHKDVEMVDGACLKCEALKKEEAEAAEKARKADEGLGGYIIDDEKTGKHLPTRVNGKLDHHHMGAAAAALGEGYRGQKYEGPHKQEAVAKLKKLYKEENMEYPGEKSEATVAKKSLKVLRFGNPVTVLRIGGYEATADDMETARKLHAGKLV